MPVRSGAGQFLPNLHSLRGGSGIKTTLFLCGLLVASCASNTKTETDTVVDGLWCLGFCQHFVVEQDTDSETQAEAEEPEQ